MRNWLHPNRGKRQFQQAAAVRRAKLRRPDRERIESMCQPGAGVSILWGTGAGMWTERLTSQSEQQLTDLIYSALLGESSWQDFLDRLNQLVPAGVSTLFFHDQLAADGAIALASGLEEQHARAYADYYAALNPWMQNVAATPLRLGIVGERIVPREEFVRSEYYADFLRRQDIEAGIGVTLWREQGVSFLLSMLTAHKEPEDNQKLADLLTRLSPHLVRAFRFYRGNRLGEFVHEVSGPLLASPKVGVIVVGSDLRVRIASPAGQRRLAQGGLVGLTAAGGLRLSDEGAMGHLRQMLARVDPGPRSRILHIRPSRLTMIRIEVDGVSSYFSGPTVAVIIEDPDPTTFVVDMTWFAGRFGLTPAESRVVAGVSGGLTLVEIADQAGVRLETIRSQIKSVYGKTGVSRQGDLIRLAMAHRAR